MLRRAISDLIYAERTYDAICKATHWDDLDPGSIVGWQKEVAAQRCRQKFAVLKRLIPDGDMRNKLYLGHPATRQKFAEILERFHLGDSDESDNSTP